MSYGSTTLHMTTQGLAEMFEGDFADTCAKTHPLMSMWGGGQEDGQACADPFARTPIGMSGIYFLIFLLNI